MQKNADEFFRKLKEAPAEALGNDPAFRRQMQADAERQRSKRRLLPHLLHLEAQLENIRRAVEADDMEVYRSSINKFNECFALHNPYEQGLIISFLPDRDIHGNIKFLARHFAAKQQASSKAGPSDEYQR